ncbi:uncharacterized protein LOC143289430 [Babylonia areolata]|uniref:uncharacterized protein LOC143289430 n=1 Tax=Babylonia areolata TaxID=304850 RepID=UPI003FD31036
MGVNNESLPQGCIEIRLRKLEFLPWNNPDSIVDADVTAYARKGRYVMLLILFLIGGPANVINMAVFCRQGLRDRVNLILFSLSLSDGLYLASTMVQYGEEMYLQFFEETNGGAVLKFMVNNHLIGCFAFCYVSFTLSAIIACERCYCVLRPLKYQTLLRTRTMAVIIITVFVVVLGLYFIVVLRYYFVCAYDPELGIKMTMLSHSEFYRNHKDLIDYLDSIFYGVVLPGSMTIAVVTATIITTSRLQQAVAWRAETSSSLSPREVALTKMLIGTSVLLIVCVSPGCLFRIACLFLPEMNTGQRNQNLYLTCLWTSEVFVFTNSSLNIFVYYAMGSRYRETFWGLFQSKAKIKNNEK